MNQILGLQIAHSFRDIDGVQNLFTWGYLGATFGEMFQERKSAEFHEDLKVPNQSHAGKVNPTMTGTVSQQRPMNLMMFG